VASHLPGSATRKNQNNPSETNRKDPSTLGNTAQFNRSQKASVDRMKDHLSVGGVLVEVLFPCVHVYMERERKTETERDRERVLRCKDLS
jgi:hypothetical protein